MAKSTGERQSYKDSYNKEKRPKITAIVDKDLYDLVKFRAQESGKNVSWWINDFLKEHLK